MLVLSDLGKIRIMPELSFTTRSFDGPRHCIMMAPNRSAKWRRDESQILFVTKVSVMVSGVCVLVLYEESAQVNKQTESSRKLRCLVDYVTVADAPQLSRPAGT